MLSRISPYSAVVVTFHTGWLSLVPTGPLVAAAFCFFVVIRPREWEIGPEPEEAYREDRKKSPSRIHMSMVSQVMWAADRNRNVLDTKSMYLRWGYAFLGLALASTFVVAVIDRLAN